MKAFLRRIPGISNFESYRLGLLPGDLAAGITLGVVMIPVGLAFGELAGLPMAGLYASILPLIAYAIFGGARLLVVSPDAAMAALIAASLGPLAAGNGMAYAHAVSMVAALIAVILGIGALCRLGFVADLLAKPVTVGFLHGTALVIALGQLPKALGIHPGGIHSWDPLVGVLRNSSGVNWIDAAIALTSCAIVLLLPKYASRVPGQVLVLIAASLAVLAFNLEAHGVAIVGHVPAGLPRLELPLVSWSILGELLPVAFTGAFLAFADVMVLTRALAARRHEHVNSNKEMFALALSNAAAALTQGLPVSGSGSRTAVAESAGARSRMSLIVAALTVLLVLVFLTPLLRPLPVAALAGILIAAAWNLCDFSEFRRMWHFRRTGFALAVITMVGVVVAGMLTGILVGVLLSICLLLWHLSVPDDAILGIIPGGGEYRDVARNSQAREKPGTRIYRFSGPLFYANAARFVRRVEGLASDPTLSVRLFVIDASGITAIDLAGIEALVALAHSLRENGVTLRIASAIGSVRDALARAGAIDAIGPNAIFPTIDAALR